MSDSMDFILTEDKSGSDRKAAIDLSDTTESIPGDTVSGTGDAKVAALEAFDNLMEEDLEVSSKAKEGAELCFEDLEDYGILLEGDEEANDGKKKGDPGVLLASVENGLDFSNHHEKEVKFKDAEECDVLLNGNDDPMSENKETKEVAYDYLSENETKISTENKKEKVCGSFLKGF